MTQSIIKIDLKLIKKKEKKGTTWLKIKVYY